ncbi:unnamed protein product [Rangifer tarandus platyrhynchus]|uniref:Uncharacterized protein n=1 Tax=Rangifer tarandus platyrhynchus TaxID=3082113 RepID=A0ABN8Y1Q3_RANTA|nr:unnamed protein product [Rangifer tarandus platyrhynchus]
METHMTVPGPRAPAESRGSRRKILCGPRDRTRCRERGQKDAGANGPGTTAAPHKAAQSCSRQGARAGKRRRVGNKGCHSNLRNALLPPRRSRPSIREPPDPNLAFTRGGSSCPSEGSRPLQRTPVSLSSSRPP